MSKQSVNLSSIKSLLEPALRHPSNKIIIALSGGLDSVCLLHLLVQWREENPSLKLNALHVNHHLHAQSIQWQDFCKKRCDDYQIEYQCVDVNIASPHTNLESRARTLRYNAFKSAMSKDDVLVTAHHSDDQVETFFLNLMRASGLDGLRAMPRQKALAHGLHIRPLLAYSREDLHQYALAQKLQWVDDPSNLSLDYDRNYIRHQIMPCVKIRWNHASESINLSIDHLQHQSQLLDDYALNDLTQLALRPCGVFAAAYKVLDIDQLKHYSNHKIAHLLRLWLSTHGAIRPSNAQLNDWIKVIIKSSGSDQRVLFDLCDHQLRIYRNGLYLMATLPEIKLDDTSQPLKSSLVSAKAGELEFKLEQLGIKVRLSLPSDNEFDQQKLSFYSRQTADLQADEHEIKSTSLKKKFQQNKIPQWERDYLPFIYYQQELIAIAGIAETTQAGQIKIDGVSVKIDQMP